MTWSIAFVFAVVLVTAALFASERLRLDVVAFLGLTALLVSGILTVPEALAGFADPTVHMIAGLFVVGGAIFHTGLADAIGQSLEKRGGGSPQRLLLSLLLVTSGLSAFLSSTGTVAVMIPVAATLARRSGTSPSQLMIPLAFATLLGGLLTLIATPPNMIVSSTLERAGLAPFGFFDFTGPGLVLLGLGIGFLCTVGPRLLPTNRREEKRRGPPDAHELWKRYGLEDWIFEHEILEDSPLVGRTIAQCAVRSSFSVGIFAIRSRNETGKAERAQAERILRAGDHLTIKGDPDKVRSFEREMRLRELGRPEGLPAGLAVAEFLLPPDSAFIGTDVKSTRLRSRFDVNVMAVFRSKSVLRDSVANTELHVGDLLLVLGTARSLSKLRDEAQDVILVTETEDLRQASFRRDRAPHALAILGLMLGVMSLSSVPPVVAVICAALAMVLVGCIDAGNATRSINWESVLLIAALLPLATALTKTGALDLIVNGLVSSLGGSGPYVVLTALFALTAVVGLVVSNTATAVLLAPVALQVAERLGLRPAPLLMTVAIAASAAFLTPVSSPVNMMVMNAGGYRFTDFTKIGAPLLLLVLLGTLVVVPLFFPFH